VVKALALGGEEPGNPGAVVGRLDQLDLRLAHAEEGDSHAVLGDIRHGLELEAEQVPPERERLVDRANDERDMMDLAQSPDPGRHVFNRAGDGHRALLRR
jgi:hypothetical protein